MGKWFFPDPNRPEDHICYQCHIEIQDALYDFYLDDLESSMEYDPSERVLESPYRDFSLTPVKDTS